MEIDFEKMQGLAPAIVQDAANGEVLMLGFMNREALQVFTRSFPLEYLDGVEECAEEGKIELYCTPEGHEGFNA